MPASIQFDHDNIYRVQLTGLLRKVELERVQQAAKEAIAIQHRIKLLFILDHFEGWERNARWGDMQFYIEHDKDIDKIAVVGAEQWRDHALMFAGAGLRKAGVEFFQPHEMVRALAWLAEPGIRGS